VLRSAFKDVTERADCWVGAKAEAEARRAAAATNFIMVSKIGMEYAILNKVHGSWRCCWCFLRVAYELVALVRDARGKIAMEDEFNRISVHCPLASVEWTTNATVKSRFVVCPSFDAIFPYHGYIFMYRYAPILSTYETHIQYVGK
jgi:hypothetical protein